MSLSKDFRVRNDADMPLDFVRALNQGQLPRGFGDWLYKRMLNQKQRAGIPAEATEANGFVLEDSENIGNVFFADIRMDGFSATATFDPESEELKGPMPANLDGLSLGAIQTFVKRIFIGDAASDKRERNGLYVIADGITSADPNLVLKKVPNWANKGKLTFVRYGTYASQAAEFTAINQVADTYKGSEPWEQAKSELFSVVLSADGIYTVNLPDGTVGSDGLTLTGLGALPITHGYTPVNNRPIFLAGQTDKKQNGYWIVSNKDTGSLSRLSWHFGASRVKRNHLIVVTGGGAPYKNTIWRAQAPTEGIDPLTTDVDYEQVGESSQVAQSMEAPSGSVVAANCLFDGNLEDDSANNYHLEATFGSVSYVADPFVHGKKALFCDGSNLCLQLIDSNQNAAWQALIKTTGCTVFFAMEMMEYISQFWLFSVMGPLVAGANNNRLFVSFMNLDRTLLAETEPVPDTLNKTLFPSKISRGQMVFALKIPTNGVYEYITKDGAIAANSSNPSAPADGGDAELSLFGAIDNGSNPLKAIVSQMLVIQGTSLTTEEVQAVLATIDV